MISHMFTILIEGPPSAWQPATPNLLGSGGSCSRGGLLLGKQVQGLSLQLLLLLRLLLLRLLLLLLNEVLLLCRLLPQVVL